MKNSRQKEDFITLRVTTAQKNKLKRLSDLEEKTLSEFVLNAVLSPNFDRTKLEIFTNLNRNLEEIKKSQKILTHLILTIGSEKLPIDKSKIMEFYSELIEETK